MPHLLILYLVLQYLLLALHKCLDLGIVLLLMPTLLFVLPFDVLSELLLGRFSLFLGFQLCDALLLPFLFTCLFGLVLTFGLVCKQLVS